MTHRLRRPVAQMILKDREEQQSLLFGATRRGLSISELLRQMVSGDRGAPNLTKLIAEFRDQNGRDGIG